MVGRDAAMPVEGEDVQRDGDAENRRDHASKREEKNRGRAPDRAC